MAWKTNRNSRKQGFSTRERDIAFSPCSGTRPVRSFNRLPQAAVLRSGLHRWAHQAASSSTSSSSSHSPRRQPALPPQLRQAARRQPTPSRYHLLTAGCGSRSSPSRPPHGRRTAAATHPDAYPGRTGSLRQRRRRETRPLTEPTDWRPSGGRPVRPGGTAHLRRGGRGGNAQL